MAATEAPRYFRRDGASMLSQVELSLERCRELFDGVATVSQNLPGLKRLSESLSQSSRDTGGGFCRDTGLLLSEHGQSTACPGPCNVALSWAVAASSGCTSRS